MQTTARDTPHAAAGDAGAGTDTALIAALGPPIAGPSALGDDRRRLLRIATTLAFTDIKLRFFGSVLGYLWQLMRPLLLFGVLYVVFSQFLSFDAGVKFYPVSLLLGIVLFNFFGEMTGQSVRSLVNREPLIRKIDFPRLAVPLATIITALVNLALNLIPVLIFLLASGGRPRLSWLEIPVLVAGLTVFGAGLALLLSAMFVRYRDIEPIWDVALQALFYAAPIFYTVEVVREKTQLAWLPDAILCNPFAAVLQQFRHAFIDPSHASVVSELSSPALVLIPIGISVTALVAGFVVFNRRAPHIAEEL
jgi:ABC-2 type transport system permease protein